MKMRIGELARILQRTFDRGGNVVIPSFAVGRTQELLYFIREIKKEGLASTTRRRWNGCGSYATAACTA